MKKYILKKRKLNRGTALLFSLGILSLIVVLAMLFASKAKANARISAIQLDNQEAKSLAKSLIPRIIVTLQENQRTQDSVMFSSTYDPDFTPAKSEDRSFHNDWLWKLETDSVLSFSDIFGTEGLATYLEGSQYKQENMPLWQYIHDPNGRPENESAGDSDSSDTKNNSGRVMARFAFVTIPQSGTLNPNAIANHQHCRHLAAIKSQNDKCNVCARRLGNSPAELFFTANHLSGDSSEEYNRIQDDLKKVKKSGASAGLVNQGDGQNVTAPLQDNLSKRDYNVSDKTWNYWKNMSGVFASFGVKEPPLSASSGKDEYYELLASVESVLTPSISADKEAYWGGQNRYALEKEAIQKDKDKDGKFYHRFNLRRTDWENLDIDDLTEQPREYNYEEDKDKAGYDQPSLTGDNERGNFNTGGIAWFRNWKDDDANGYKWKDSVTKKNQILANLLNFCSPASRPVVSDVDPTEWLSCGDDEPSYTGLKRTLYLNEFFAGLSVYGNSENTGTKVSSTYYIDYYLITEAVDMYLNTLGDEANDPREVNPKNWSDFVWYKPQLKGSLSLEVWDASSGINGDWKKVEINLENLDHMYMSGMDIDGSIAARMTKGGYFGYMARGEDGSNMPCKEYTFDVDIPDSGVVPNVEMKIRNVKLNIKRIVLKRGKSRKDDNKTFPTEKTVTEDGITFEFVDCARLNSGDITLLSGEDNVKVEGADRSGWFGYVGWEVDSDPRMNLNPDDWKQYAGTNGTSVTEPQMDANKFFIANCGKAGGPNGQTLPLNDVTGLNSTIESAYATKSSNKTRDYEIRTDPSWQRGVSNGKLNGVKSRAGKGDHISTAFIRHADLEESRIFKGTPVEYPMESLWELGAVHRAGHWQTLNIAYTDKEYIESEKVFKDLGGGAYSKGDGPLLDQVKMTNDIEMLGKINIERMARSMSKNFCLGALFLDMPFRTEGNYMRQAIDNTSEMEKNVNIGGSPGGSDYVINSREREELIKENPKDERYDFRAYASALHDAVFGKPDVSWEGLYADSTNLDKDGKEDDREYYFNRRSDLLAAPATQFKDDLLYPIRASKNEDTTDALDEQIIGRTMNLIKVQPGVKAVTAILLVQMIQDSGDTYLAKDWNADGKIEGDLAKELRQNKNRAAQFQSGYRDFKDAAEGDSITLFAKPNELKEVIEGRKGVYNNGADSITGEAKVKVSLKYYSDENRWKVEKYEYVE